MVASELGEVSGPAVWPDGDAYTDQGFLRFADGKMLRSELEHIELRPWTPATELPPCDVVDGMIRLPTLCNKHFVFYPSALVQEAMRGRFYAFATMCECEMAYLVETEPDGAHCKAAATPEAISELYENLPGDEVHIGDHGGGFICKRLPAAAET